jgi:hypothetical protein
MSCLARCETVLRTPNHQPQPHRLRAHLCVLGTQHVLVQPTVLVDSSKHASGDIQSDFALKDLRVKMLPVDIGIPLPQRFVH